MKKTFYLLAAVLLVVSACNNNKTNADRTMVKGISTPMSDEEKEARNKKIAMASIEGLQNHNIDQVLKDVAADAVDYGDGSMAAVKGLDSIRSGMKTWLQAFPDVKGSNLVYVADDDWVVVWGDWSGTFKNDFMGQKATGKSYKVKDADIFKFTDDGKIKEHYNIQSPMTTMMQVGMKMDMQHHQHEDMKKKKM